MDVRVYTTSSGRSPVEEFVRGASQEAQNDFFDAVLLLSAGKSLSLPHSRPLANIHPGLHELRIHDRAGQIRIFYYVKKGDAIYMIHAFRKKTQQLPQREIEVALKRLKEV
jgi:phage-related protein